MTFIDIFVKRELKKKKICSRYEIKFADEDAIDEGAVSIVFYIRRQGLKKIFLKIFLMRLV